MSETDRINPFDKPTNYGAQPGYPPPQGGAYPPPGQGPPQGGYPPAGQAPPQGGYPPPGQAPPQGGYPPAGQAPPQGGYPPAGQPGATGPGSWDPTVEAGMGANVLGGHGSKHGADLPVGGQGGLGEEPIASAPPLDKMDTIQGYSGLGYDGSAAPPPSYDDVMKGPAPQREPPKDVPVITEEQARDALGQFVSEHCCYGKKPVQQLRFNDLKSTSAFHYTLETFTESRTTAWAFEPFHGQNLDTPMNGPAPGPWDIQIAPTCKFKNQEQHMEVPHTASVKPCHTCFGNGRVRCHHCSGHGNSRCTHCHGRGREDHYHDGHHETRTCTWCHGDGRRRCTWCHGYGHQECPTCRGRGQLKCYIRLTVKWINHLEDHIVEKTDLPDHLIRKVSGQTAFEEELPWVWPINHFPDQAINTASNQLVQKHRTAFNMERLLMQRHRVRIVPVTEVHTRYSDKPFQYYVYGFEHKVHAPDYPSQCCCGCTIL